MFSIIYKFFIADKQKAIIAGIVATVGSYALANGWNLDMTLKEALQALLVGLFSHTGVYWTANK